MFKMFFLKYVDVANKKTEKCFCGISLLLKFHSSDILKHFSVFLFASKTLPLHLLGTVFADILQVSCS